MLVARPSPCPHLDCPCGPVRSQVPLEQFCPPPQLQRHPLSPVPHLAEHLAKAALLSPRHVLVTGHKEVSSTSGQSRSLMTSPRIIPLEPPLTADGGQGREPGHVTAGAAVEKACPQGACPTVSGLRGACPAAQPGRAPQCLCVLVPWLRFPALPASSQPLSPRWPAHVRVEGAASLSICAFLSSASGEVGAQGPFLWHDVTG